MAKKIRIRRDTAANWTQANPTLALGEFGYETDTESVVGGVKYYRMKVGNGEDAWEDLPYAGWGDPGAGGGGAGPVAWNDITGKPSTFTPSAHTHSWSEITSKPSTFTPSAHEHTINEVTGLITALSSLASDADLTAAIGALKDGVAAEGDTLQKLYNLIISGQEQFTVADISERDAIDVQSLNIQVFVTDDGDGRWAIYKPETLGLGASWIKISDPDLLNAVMSASQIKTAYESNPDTNALTNALKSKLDSITAIFTTSLKDAYDTAAAWVSLNGAAALAKQDALVSGSNIKTLNGVSVLGSGDLRVRDSFRAQSQALSFASGTRFICLEGGASSASETAVLMVAEFDMVITGIIVRTNGAQATNPYTLTLRRNQASTALTLTIPVGQAANSVLSVSQNISIAAGDLICLQGVGVSSSASLSQISIPYHPAV